MEDISILETVIRVFFCCERADFLWIIGPEACVISGPIRPGVIEPLSFFSVTNRFTGGPHRSHVGGGIQPLAGVSCSPSPITFHVQGTIHSPDWCSHRFSIDGS